MFGVDEYLGRRMFGLPNILCGWMLRLPNVWVDECLGRRMFRATNVWVDECSEQQMFGSTNVQSNKCLGWQQFGSMNVEVDKLLADEFLGRRSFGRQVFGSTKRRRTVFRGAEFFSRILCQLCGSPCQIKPSSLWKEINCNCLLPCAYLPTQSGRCVYLITAIKIICSRCLETGWPDWANFRTLGDG
jgi:hypothetical protein